MTFRERSQFKAKLELHVQHKALWLSHELTGILIERGWSIKELATKADVPLREVRDMVAGIPQKWMYQIGEFEIALEAPILVTRHQCENMLLRDPERLKMILKIALEKAEREKPLPAATPSNNLDNFEPQFTDCKYQRTMEFKDDN